MNRNWARLAVPLGVVGIVMLLVVPVPAPLLDVLIILNILFALVILLTTMFVKRPLDFSIFPSLLLVATLFRLGLNVASTRLVLGEAYAGQVIAAFGHVAVGGSIIIGSVVFLILVAVWCAAGRLIGTHKAVTETLERVEHWLVPVVFIGLGLFILIESGVIVRLFEVLA